MSRDAIRHYRYNCTMLHYAGLNIGLAKIFDSRKECRIFDEFIKINVENVTDLTIGWNYFLVWQGTKVFVHSSALAVTGQLTIPANGSSRFTCGIAGKHAITLLTTDHQIWQYKILENVWNKIDRFISSNDDGVEEYVIKLVGYRTIVALTNLGRVFNVPALVDIPKRIKFVDVVCGFEHTLLLADNGDICSMGIGSRGQLGHGDLEDYSEPKLIEALAGLKVVQISAAGWHSAAVTSEGDVYAWGWNTNGELGIISEQKVFAIPTIVNFTTASNEEIEVKINKVECGNAFTVCISDDQKLWGCGSNKYGQLGQDRHNLLLTNKFVELTVNLNKIIDIKCQEWGTAIKSR